MPNYKSLIAAYLCIICGMISPRVTSGFQHIGPSSVTTRKPVSFLQVSNIDEPHTPPEVKEKEVVENDDDDDDNDDEATQMAKLMGFSGFDTTHQKQVKDPKANVSGVFKKTKREARQYMNRPGGFNKPLPSEKTK